MKLSSRLKARLKNAAGGGTPAPSSSQSLPTRINFRASRVRSRRKSRKSKQDENNRDPIEELYRRGANRADQLAQYALMPLFWAGNFLSTAMQQILGSRAYGFLGACLAVLGCALSAEAYYTGFGGFQFIPKPGLEGVADPMRLWELLTTGWMGDRVQFVAIALLAIGCQIIESAPFRLRFAKNKALRGTGQVSILTWGLIGIAYALDLHSVWKTYLALGFSLPALLWGVLTLGVAEMGLALAQLSKEA